MANKAKLEELMKDEKILAALKACESLEAALALVNEHGADMTAEELMAAMPADNEAMNLDDMENVAGGGLGDLWDAFKGLFETGIHKQSPDDVILTQELENGTVRKFIRDGRVRDEMLDANGNGRVIEYESVTALIPTKDTITVNGTTYATPEELRY